MLAGPMRFLPLIFALFLALQLPQTPLCAEHAYEGTRLRVRGDVPEVWIETAVDLLKSLYPALSEQLGRAPDESELPLRLVIHPDRATYKRALRKAGVKVPLGRSGGFTFWQEGESHVYLQGDDFHSRRLILHELTHQFHAKCRPPTRRGRGAWWYREGLAEYYGWHRRRAAGVDFGRVHPLTLAGTARQAQACVQHGGFRAWRVAIGAEEAGYAQALALVAPLLDGPDEDLRARFRAWEREVLERGGDTKAFARHFKGTEERLEAAIRTFWLEHEYRWTASGGAWVEDRGALVAQAGTTPAILRSTGFKYTGAAQARLRVDVTLGATPPASAGILLDAGEGALAALVDGRRIVVLRRDGAATTWREVASHPFASRLPAGRPPPSNGPISLTLAVVLSDRRQLVFEAQADGVRAVLRVPHDQLGSFAVASVGSPGLFVRHGRATFRNFGVGSPPK